MQPFLGHSFYLGQAAFFCVTFFDGEYSEPLSAPIAAQGFTVLRPVRIDALGVIHVCPA